MSRLNRCGWLARSIVAICLSNALGGCVSHQKYPRTWSALDDRAAACEQIAGEYRNQGESGDASPKLLSNLLLGDAPHGAIPLVRLAFVGDGAVEVEGAFTTAQDQLPTRFLSRDQVECKRGKLLIRAGGRWEFRQAGELPIISVGRVMTSLELTVGGNYLVVKEKTKAVGAAMVIPLVYHGETWYRFERVPVS